MTSSKKIQDWEKESGIKVKYPRVWELLQKLYTSAYKEGVKPSNEDGYDHSSAYEEIELGLLDEVKKARRRDFKIIERVIYAWGDCGACLLKEELEKKLKELKSK